MIRAEPSAGDVGDLRALRRDPGVRAIAHAWRRLTGGKPRERGICRRTLIACSGGADSSGLAIALAAAVGEPAGLFVLAHIVHDLRPESEALADRDAARRLAKRLGVPFAEAGVRVRDHAGNPEAVARRLRYQALAELAERDACGFVATAHHADDQLETLLMGLLRGAGPGGMRGVRPRRRIAEDSVVIRPALDVGRSDLERLCRAFGWEWREDVTNSDTARLRAAIRHRVTPVLKELRPGVELRAGRTARLLGEASEFIAVRARELLSEAETSDGSFRVSRPALRKEMAIVVGEVLRQGAVMARGERGQDRLGGAALDPMVAAVLDGQTDQRTFRRGGLEVAVSARWVTLRRQA